MVSALWFGLAAAIAAYGPPAGAADRATVALSAPMPTPQFRRYGPADGLPTGIVYGVARGRHGFMWFATSNGLARYDGVDFKVYRHVVDDPTSMPSNESFLVYRDRQERLWIGGISSGLTLYLEGRDEFRSWQHDPKDPRSLSDNEVWSVAQTPDGRIWVATGAGLDRMRPDGQGFEHIALPQTRDDLSKEVRSVLAEEDGRLWIATRHGLYVRESDGRIHAAAADPAIDFKKLEPWRIDNGGGGIRIATLDQLLSVDAHGTVRPSAGDPLGELHMTSSVRDQRGRLWISTMSGLLLDDGQGRPHLFANQSFMANGLPGNEIWQMARDREGGFWFALGESGVAYLSPHWDRFSVYGRNPEASDSLAGTVTTRVERSRDGKLWVIGQGWVDKLDPHTGHVEHVVQGLLQGTSNGFAEDRRGRLWITTAARVYMYSQGRLVQPDPDRLAMDFPSQIKLTADGRVYVDTRGQGLFEIDPDSLAIRHIPMTESSDAARKPEQLLIVNGEPWYANSAGLMRLNAQHRLEYVQGAPRVDIATAALDSDGQGLWIKLFGPGLEHYRLLGNRLRRDRVVQGDAAFWDKLNIYDMRVDAWGQLWVFGTSGLWRLDAASGRFQTFDAQDGLANLQITNDGSTSLDDGSMYLATSNGVVGFNPRQLAVESNQTLLPEVVLSRIRVDRGGKTVDLDAQAPALELGWRDRDLRIEARVASYVSPTDNHYQFRLDGFDLDWVDVGRHGEREFAGLGAGHYVLEARGAGASGAWGQAAAPLMIDIEAPPWERWWAWLFYLLAAAVLGWLALQAWRKRLLHNHELQQAARASRAKSQFLAMLGHEIRTPMTGVMGMAELLLATPLNPLQREYATTMQRSGGLLLKLVNDALDLARIEAGRLELEAVVFDPAELLREVARLDMGLAVAKGIVLAVEIGDAAPAWVCGDVVRVKQVLLNLVNNALKFTERGRVTLGLQAAEKGVRFSVSDTGPGISEAGQTRLFQRFEQGEGPQRKAGSGLGLAICRELVSAMDGHIELASRLGHGSVFHVQLPLPAAEPPVGSVPLRSSSRALCLLLVEDDATVAAVIVGLLESQGHAVKHVVHGLAALAELANADVDAMLLDLDLPGVDGFQIARMVRQQESEHRNRRLPIIAVTARSGGDEEVRTREAGMDGFLRKPVSGEQLAQALAEHVLETQAG